MKLLLTLFLLGLLGQTESKSIVYQFKHTSYFYNSTQCNNSVPTIVEFINYDNCIINDLNKCIYSIYPKNGSVFKTCSFEPVTNNYNVKVSVILTILLMFLAFLLYKLCCQPELDSVCLKIKFKCEDFCYNEDDEETHLINDYNSL
jgi:hypothetical protein